jgi:hypothetical protein
MHKNFREVMEGLRLSRMRGPAAAIAIPAAVSLIGSYMAKRSADKQANTLQAGLTPGPYENLSRRGSLSTAGALSAEAPGLLGLGRTAVGQGAGYYSSLLGSRTAAQAATAPAAAGIREQAAGAERGLSGLVGRSAGASTALAESQRQTQGQVARLTAGVQPMAAAKLAEIGSDATAHGLGALSGAGSIYGGSANNATYGRLGTSSQLSGILGQQSTANQQTGSNMAGILQQLLSNKPQSSSVNREVGT